MGDDFIPKYRKVRNIEDVDWNQGQMIQAFNHGMGKMAKCLISQGTDIKWIKRIFMAVIIAAICDMFGLIPA